MYFGHLITSEQSTKVLSPRAPFGRYQNLGRASVYLFNVLTIAVNVNHIPSALSTSSFAERQSIYRY